ncbi:MAG: polysaccharide biosynthesis/export family protein [Undibacterium sp.]|nr:polysaccharide biosynthesis/export family protein [Opitutaceae bacterium]
MLFSSRPCLLALGAAVLALIPGCATDTIKDTNPVIPAATTTAQLRPGDSLTIALQGVPDPSTNTVQIDDQGLITLPFIGPHPAAGVSTANLSTHIRETYIAKKIYNTVDVSVSVTERYVYVGGEVAKPGRIIWTPDLTVTKAVQAAGGFSLYAKEGKVTLVRDQHAYELNARLAQQNPAQDPRLMPGDSLQVPRSAF